MRAQVIMPEHVQVMIWPRGTVMLQEPAEPLAVNELTRTVAGSFAESI